jgi:hypothetical protein
MIEQMLLTKAEMPSVAVALRVWALVAALCEVDHIISASSGPLSSGGPTQGTRRGNRDMPTNELLE